MTSCHLCEAADPWITGTFGAAFAAEAEAWFGWVFKFAASVLQHSTFLHVCGAFSCGCVAQQLAGPFQEFPDNVDDLVALGLANFGGRPFDAVAVVSNYGRVLWAGARAPD